MIAKSRVRSSPPWGNRRRQAGRFGQVTPDLVRRHAAGIGGKACNWVVGLAGAAGGLCVDGAGACCVLEDAGATEYVPGAVVSAGGHAVDATRRHKQLACLGAQHDDVVVWEAWRPL